MSKKISVSVFLSLMLIAIMVTFSITMVLAMRIFDNAIPAVLQKQVLNSKLYEIDKYVRSNYYGQIDDGYLGDRTARGYINGLRDPNAVYYSAAEYTELRGIENGTIVGIGLVLTRDPNGYLRIVRVHPDSPAAQAGILPEGFLESIDGKPGRQFTLPQAYAALRGEAGTTVDLGVQSSVAQVENFLVQRIGYTAPTMYLEMQGSIAYVRIESLASNSFAEFDHILRTAESHNAQGYIFDVRGYAWQDIEMTQSLQYDQVFSMIDRVCPVGTFATVEYKNNTTAVLRSSDNEAQLKYPMVVLVNELTSGPTELFATSLRQLAGASLVGGRTAGNGMLQAAPLRISDGSALSFTYAHLLAYDGLDFNGLGLVPDSEWPIAEGDIDLMKVQFSTDAQVQRAVQILYTLASQRGFDLSIPSAPSASSAPSLAASSSLPASSSSSGSASVSSSSSPSSSAQGGA